MEFLFASNKLFDLTNFDERCALWAGNGECSANSKYMHSNCAASCDTCNKFFVQDLKQKIRAKMENEGEKDKIIVTEAVGSNVDIDDHSKEVIKWTDNFGERQEVSGQEWKSTLEQIHKMKIYMDTEVIKNLSKDTLDSCINKYKLCSFWKVIDECNINKDWMTKNCGPACNFCHLL